ncbi:MAG: hypothetical protein HC916_05640 [Coleofasciculaceae cyanobacterium SM2_1_6]|nr:hypothetical protein [Coleofasciculaceae cyanobacterium SM2_1_6]
MQNVIKYFGVLLLLSIVLVSCDYHNDIVHTLKSFKEKRNTYETVVTNIQQYRDALGCSTSRCKLRIKDINIDKELQSNFFSIRIASSKPLIIEFNVTESIYAYIWYAETADSVEYIFSYPQVVANELTLRKLDEHWFFVKRDWN